tara:strand:- start:66 stop:227 length:162 start_codon:yes stop_codon:yes gene_type:complete
MRKIKPNAVIIMPIKTLRFTHPCPRNPSINKIKTGVRYTYEIVLPGGKYSEEN